MIDRAFGLWAGTREVHNQPTFRLGQLHPLCVQPWRIDAIVFGVVLPDVRAVRNLAKELAAEDVCGASQDRLEAALDRRAPVTSEQIRDALGAQATRGDFRVEIASQA